MKLNLLLLAPNFLDDFKEKYRNYIYNVFKLFTEKKRQDKLIKIELSSNLSKLSPFLSKKDFFELFSKLNEESCDSVRFNLVEAITNLKNLSNLTGYENFISESIVSFSHDESWRVRLMLAKYMEELLILSSTITNNSEINNNLLKSYIKLLQDSEGEVRSMACKKLDIVSEYLGKEESFDKVLSCLKSLKADSLSYVRSSLASIVLSLAPKIGPKKTNEYIFPIFLRFNKR